MSSKEPKSLLPLFLSVPVGDHIPRATTGDVIAQKVGPVLVVQRDESLPRVLRKLTVEGFLSAPVLDGRRFVGFVDMMDLVRKTRDLFWGDSVEAWVDFWDKESKFSDTTVDDVMKLPNTFDRDPSPPLESTYSTFSALEIMVHGNFHRLALVKPKSAARINGIITQSMIISWLRQNKSLFGTLATLRVRDMIDTLKEDCRTINENITAINAFTEMANEGISGLAVVDDQGVLTGAISIRDLRAVGAGGEYFHRLFRTIKEFKKLARDEHPRLAPITHYSRRTVPRQGRFVTMDNTIVDVIDKMADGNIHRVFVCDDKDQPKPLYAISQVDVLRVVLEHMINESKGIGMAAYTG